MPWTGSQGWGLNQNSSVLCKAGSALTRPWTMGSSFSENKLQVFSVGSFLEQEQCLAGPLHTPSFTCVFIWWLFTSQLWMQGLQSGIASLLVDLKALSIWSATLCSVNIMWWQETSLRGARNHSTEHFLSQSPALCSWVSVLTAEGELTVLPLRVLLLIKKKKKKINSKLYVKKKKNGPICEG